MLQKLENSIFSEFHYPLTFVILGDLRYSNLNHSMLCRFPLTCCIKVFLERTRHISWNIDNLVKKITVIYIKIGYKINLSKLSIFYDMPSFFEQFSRSREIYIA